MKIYLATWLFESSHGEALTKMNKKERLLSYFHVLQKKDDFVRYVKTGRNDENDGIQFDQRGVGL